MEALHSAIEALSARLKRHVNSPQAPSKQIGRRPARRVDRTQYDEVATLKSALEKLSLLNTENSKKVKLLESALKNKEIDD